MTFYSHNDPCGELRTILHRSLASLGCPHVPSLPLSTFLTTTNTNIKIIMWLLGEIDPDLAQRLHANRGFNSIGFVQEFFLESSLFPRSFISHLDEIFANPSSIELHQLALTLASYIHKPIVGNNVQLGLIEYLSELLVSIRNPPMIVHQDMWNNREVLNMFEQLPMDEMNLAIDSRILEYIDTEPQSTDDEQTSADLNDVLAQVRVELLAQINNRNDTEIYSTFTREQTDEMDKQLQAAFGDMHQFFKRLETGPSHVNFSIDQNSASLMSNETLHKLNSIGHLNELQQHVRANDKIFIDKTQQLISDIDKENETDPNSSLTLQAQVMLARNLAHTLSNCDSMKKK